MTYRIMAMDASAAESHDRSLNQARATAALAVVEEDLQARRISP